jgi:general secretion pathway protein L
MLNEIFVWWLRQMLTLVPPQLRRQDNGPANAIVLAWNELGGDAELLMRRDHKETSLGRFALDESGMRLAVALLGNRRAPATVLRLPAGLLLDREVTLPLAAEQGLDRVVRYEMDRFTPFSADEVFFSCAVQRRDRAQGKLLVAISLVPRARLVPAIEALTRLGLTPGLLEAPDALGGAPHRIELGAVDRAGRFGRQRRLIAAGAANAVLLLVAIILPFWLQSSASDAVEQRIAELKPTVDQAEVLRRRLEASAAGSDAIVAERSRVGDALHSIATLTDLLGNDTYLLGFSLQKRQVTLEGQSAAAARLLTTLSANPAVRNAAFAAPVTRSASGADLFSIRAEMAP